MLGVNTAAKLYRKLGASCGYTRARCQELATIVDDIQRLKKEKNAIVLAHSYVLPEITYGVADAVGDSLYLAKKARDTRAEFIVFAAVRFMAETAALLAPQKTVLLPATNPGCTLAESITAQKVRELRKKHPTRTFVCYINTTARVKALCDVCVTSGNAVATISRIPNEKIFFLPDHLMAKNIAAELEEKGIYKDIISSSGTCYVHEKYTPSQQAAIRREHPRARIFAHPECAPVVAAGADFVGSTGQMIAAAKQSSAQQFFVMTECGLADRLKTELPEKEFVGACQLCRYMKSSSLSSIRACLAAPRKKDIVRVPSTIAKKALACVNTLFSYS